MHAPQPSESGPGKAEAAPTGRPSTAHITLDHPELFLNRELSWLEFNQRVLEEALDKDNPLLERLKFLCIVSSNLDEFFEIRVAGLKQQKQNNSSDRAPDGMSASEALHAIAKRVRKLVDEQYRCWREEIAPALEQNNIRFLPHSKLAAKDKKYLENYFHGEVLPVLTPLAIDPGHPFPQLLNKSLNVVVELKPEEGPVRLAVIQVPRILPRVVPLPREGPTWDFVFIGSIIQSHAGALFHGMKVKGVHQFRITRNSDLYIDEEEAENLLRTIEAELRKLNRGKAVRLEVQHDCPKHLAMQLLRIFNLDDEDLYIVDGPINFTRLFPVIAEFDRPDLKFRPFVAPVVEKLRGAVDFFGQIRKGDILLHHPYDNFQSVVDFIGHAAEDHRVLAIKQTLYRTGGDSSIVPSLMQAAENGKQVTVLVELKARFDEAANIHWARMLQEAGVHVVYGLVGYKTHCKVAMVVRRDDDGIRRYVHLATGNYHPTTAKFYTDLGILTCQPEMGEDVAELFNLLTGVATFPGMKQLLVAPWTLHEDFLNRIEREITHASQGRPASIFVKVNALVDTDIIQALYRASRAGVKIRLLIRGINCLRPQLQKYGENIEARSIVGQFLEHSRIYRFENGGNPEILLGSADWMPRNFFRRIEVVFPVLDPAAKQSIEEILEIYWEDNKKARQQQSDGTYQKLGPEEGESSRSAQAIFLAVARAKKRLG